VVGSGAAGHLQRVELTAVPILHAIVLGLVQGLAEFLPISSSGHLILVPWLFGWDDLQDPGIKKAFDVSLHIGTLVAVIGYFRKELVLYVSKGAQLLWKREKPVDADGKLAWLLVVSALPAAAIGAVFEETIDGRLGTPALIAVSLIVFGLLLAWADRRAGSRTIDDYKGPDAVKVGIFQALALNPGTSRSGITITAARTFGFSRDAAARISFLMSIPVTTGAVVWKMTNLIVDGIPDGLIAPMIVGIITSGLAGWFAVWGTIKLVRTRSFMPFVIYRCVLGVVVLVIIAAGWR
jgi:undecaprenyl-diphosphatase